MDNQQLSDIITMWLDAEYPYPYTTGKPVFKDMDKIMKTALRNWALGRTNGNQKRAALMVKVNRNTFRKWKNDIQ